MAVDLSWTFVSKVPVPNNINNLLVEGEVANDAYKTIRDVAVFTNKRLIIMDAQGFTGKKKEIYSLPYRSINMWSIENAGTLDFNAEVELWTRVGNLKINLRKDIDVNEFDRLLARSCL